MTKHQLGKNYRSAIKMVDYSDYSSHEGMLSVVDDVFHDICRTNLDQKCDIWVFVFTD